MCYRTNLFVFLFSTMIYLCLLDRFKHVVNGELWTPKNANRDYLVCPISWCPNITTRLMDRRQRCCICNSRPHWYVPQDITRNLKIEYVRRNGESVVFCDDASHDFRNSYLSLKHKYGFMTKIPSNICKFDRIVTMDLSHNEIIDVGNISCLALLDELNLSYNRVQHIGNQSFLGLKNLRILKITNNGLKTLDPSTVTGDFVQIFRLDFSNNDLEVIEFSNLISETDFCEFDFSGNNIKEIVNTNNFRIDPNKRYHGGIVDMNQNLFTKFIDFEKLGITDISILGKVFEYGFVMTDVKWTCDCHMEPYLELAEDVIKKIWRSYFNISCWNPPEHRGKTIPQIVNEGKLDIFICNFTDKCPKNCHCFYQPKHRRDVVDCSNANLTELPKELPESNNLTLVLKNNHITKFDYRQYLENTSVLDLSGNRITDFTKEALNALKLTIKLSLVNNSFTKLPREFQTLDPCRSNFGVVKLKCDCNSAWLKQWSEKGEIKNCGNTSRYLCQTINGETPIEEIDKNDICDKDISYKTLYFVIAFGLCSALLLVSAILAYKFRYELYLIQRKYMYKLVRSRLSKILPLMKYDAFISFNENNDELRCWVLNVLVKHLESAGYRLFVPCRNLPLGSVKEELLLEYILKSQNALVILCEYYKHDITPWTQIEWKYIWHNFLDISDRNVIVVNFDQLDTVDDMDQRLRAFVRLGYDIDFSNRNHDLISKIMIRLGKPVKWSWSKTNAKARFNPGRIYQKFDSREVEGQDNVFDTFSVNNTSSCHTVVHRDSIKVNILD